MKYANGGIGWEWSTLLLNGLFKCSLYRADFQKIHCQLSRRVLKSFLETSCLPIFYIFLYFFHFYPPSLPPFSSLPQFFPFPSPCMPYKLDTDSVRTATHEILTACREFYIATFLFIFNYVSTGGGTFICVSSGRLLRCHLFFHVLDDIHQPSFHM